MLRASFVSAVRGRGAASPARSVVTAAKNTTVGSRMPFAAAQVPAVARRGRGGSDGDTARRRWMSGASEAEFTDAVARSKTISSPGNDTLLSLYALYKQSTHGKCDTSKPGLLDPVGAAKWTAWNQLGDMPKNEAMATYIKLVAEHAPAQGQPQASQAQPTKGEHPSVPGLITVDVASTGVATVFLDSVTMPPALFVTCGKIFRSLSDDPSVRAIVVRAGKAKPHFSYGLDLKQAGGSLMGAKMELPRHSLHKLVRDWQEGFTAIAECRAPVIAAVDGWCIGAGLDLISAADVRVCSKDAKISLREAALGIVADLGSINRLPSIVGDSNTRMMALTACDVGADKALSMGLVSEVFGTSDEMYAAAQAMAETMAARDPNCMRGIKAIMNRAREPAIRDGLDYVAAWNSAFLPMQDIAAQLMKGK